ncbi:MAG: substrate-binding domain-containing protein, partial [Spirochaetales bacterium]|nr:substrate-binding domain-containing protein [Spirochaetales bacterium]
MGKILVIVFGILFLIFFSLSIHTIFSLSSISTESVNSEPVDFHFAFFLPHESYSFFHLVALGAEEAAEKLGCALSFHSVDKDTLDLEMARFSGIDGAVLYPSLEENKARRIVEELSDAGISVVLVEHALSDDSPWPLVGTNSFAIGKSIGELIAKRSQNPLQIAVVYSQKSPGIFAEKDLVGLGITSSLGEFLEAPLWTKVTGLNPLDAEQLTYNMLRNEPWISTVVFTDTSDTLAATQVLIDMNLVGTVQLIGFGAEDTILDYVEKGILEATVVTNPRKIGYNAVEVLMDMQDYGYSSGYVDTGSSIVTRENIKEFRAAG